MNRRRLSDVHGFIREWLFSCRDAVLSASLVGSAAPQNRDGFSLASDIDVVVLVKCIRDAEAVIEGLANRRDLDPGCPLVIHSWGVVSGAISLSPVIHLHMAEMESYVVRSALYRRALSKYPPLFGAALAAFAPATQPTLSDLLEDPLGPCELLDMCARRRFDSISWRCVATPANNVYALGRTADPVDHVLYAALHSGRNVLRTLGQYQEFSPLSKLVSMWLAAGAPRGDLLQKFVNLKRDRRHGTDVSSLCVRNAAQDVLVFLEELVCWLQRSFDGVTRVLHPSGDGVIEQPIVRDHGFVQELCDRAAGERAQLCEAAHIGFRDP